MKKSLIFVAALALIPVIASAAPLFPDAKENHWAIDALRKLASQGLIEGYPDGTFKGDRASTRYEVAMVVARLLAKMEQNNATFATKEQLQEVHKLAVALKDELAALGVRVTNLEEGVSRIDARVAELERITFYGSFESRVLAQSFKNDGNDDNDFSRGGAGVKGNPFLDYNKTVGSNVGPTLRPQVQGVLPVVDYRNGRALVNGVGFTSIARFGLKNRIDEDNEFGLEIAGFTSQGNQNIDAYWGASAPYLANPWTANQTSFNLGGQNNSPWSRVVFDHAWYEHKPTKTRLTLGYYDTLRFDPFIFAGQSNNNLYGPARFGGFGFQLLGQFDLGEDQDLKYEAMGSRFGDGGNVYAGTNYTHTVFGGDLMYRNHNWDIKLNWVRYYGDSPEANGPLTGLENITNVAYLNSSGWSQLQWVNPPGYFAGQTQTLGAGVVNRGVFQPNQVDIRPISGWNGSADNAIGITTGAGNYGAQSQNTYGGSTHFWLPLGDEKSKDGIKFTGEYAHSDYKSNRNSGYVSKGQLGRLEVATVLDDGNLTLSLAALRVDPNYNPAVFNASLLGIRFPRTYNFLGRFALYDNANYPQNREGFYLKGNYWFNEKHTSVGFKANFLQQTQTSLYDVRVKGGGIGPGIPTNDVIGFSPGFYDVVFAGFAHPNLYGARSGNSFDANLNPLENPRGYEQNLGFYAKHIIDDPKLTIDVGLERNYWKRSSSLSGPLGGSQNQVDLKSDYALLGLTWGASDSWTLRGGLEMVHTYGHHDPGGLYNGFANASGQTNFTNIDSLQTIPFVGFDNQLTKTTSWGMDFRYYTTRDHVASSIYAGAGLGSIGASTNPFSWSGPQVSSYYKLTF
jgi:hypothetical protein